VLVSRLQGDETRIQLRSSFRDSTGVLTADLTLAEDDEVRVFSVQEFRPNRYVVINGAVRKSGRVPYRDGMTVRDLILLAGGVEESAWLQEAELARLPNDRTSGATAVASRIPLDSSYLFERTADGKYKGPPGIPVSPRTTPEIALQPYDNVLIFKQPDWQLDRSVAIAGEVKFPGKYTLLAEDEKLADLVKRAGGLTTRASANGVMFYRRKGGIGRIGVNLTNALRSPSAIDNLILTDGDTIFVPGFVGTVTVSGAVNAPITVAYEPGKNLDYYVDQAGGYSKMADRKRAYVAQPNGKHAAVNRHWAWPDHVPLPEAGATVFGPQREDAGMARDNSALYSIVLQGVASLVALIIVATRK
jgi:protein involved in polysaccharide export with SLBB domain